MDIILGDMLSQLDPKVVYIFVGVMIISAVLAIIKKAIKIGIIVVIIALSVSTLGPMAKEFQDKYKFSIDSGVATIQAENNTIKLDKNTIKDIELINKGVNGYELKVKYKDDGYSHIKIPTFMAPLVKEYATKYSIPAKLVE